VKTNERKPGLLESLSLCWRSHKPKERRPCEGCIKGPDNLRESAQAVRHRQYAHSVSLLPMEDYVSGFVLTSVQLAALGQTGCKGTRVER
jgi:hypothetical protein